MVSSLICFSSLSSVLVLLFFSSSVLLLLLPSFSFFFLSSLLQFSFFFSFLFHPLLFFNALSSSHLYSYSLFFFSPSLLFSLALLCSLLTYSVFTRIWRKSNRTHLLFLRNGLLFEWMKRSWLLLLFAATRGRSQRSSSREKILRSSSGSQSAIARKII